jgi:hypothetical protein
MALVLKDRVKETTATTGTGTVTLAGAASGFQSFAAIGDGNQTYYVISDAATGDWEVGIGTYTASGTTLSRTTVLSSSNAGSLVPFAAGTKDVFVSYPSSRSVYLDTAGSAVTVLDIGTLGTSTANITTANITAGTVSTTPTNNTDIVNKQYADAIASGIHFHEAVNYATATALPACTYSNGTGGVGATLTGNVNGALTVDGYTFTSPADDGMRILIKDQASGLQNGVYTLTQAGNSSPGAPFILTRATDFDSVGTGVDQIDEGDFFLVTGGTVNVNTAWVQQTPPPITIGSTAIVFQQFAAPITYTAGTGLSESPSYTFNIATTGVTAATYGSASSVPVITVNAQGQATLVVDTPIAISGSAVSGSISGQAGSVANALTAGTYLTSGGTYDGSVARTFAVDATSANTASKVVARDASGNFSAGTITATLSGAATSATTATNIAGGAANQIPYQTGAGATSFTVAPSASNQVLNWNGSAYTWSAGTISGVPLGSNLNTLTLGTSGTGLSGSTTYNGSGAATFTVTSNATSANTASTIVARDGSGNFSAGTITASLSGTATQVSNAVTFNNGGAGGASGSTFNGSGALTVSYNTIGAPSTTGTNASGTWGINITGSAGSAGASSSVSATTSTGIQSSFITTINTTTPGLTTYGIAFSGSAAADNAQGITWGWSGTSAQAGIYVQSSGAYGTKMYFGTTNSFATGSKTSMSIDHDGVIQVPRSYLQSDSSLRAPIFYDSNDTGYYVDPNSNSRLSSISVPAGSPGFVNAARGSYFGYSSGYGTIIYGATSGNVTPCFNVDPIANPSGSFNGAGGEVMFRNGVQFISPNSSNNGYNNYFVLQDGYLAANNSLRAPIFYDSNNTGYYVDPAGTTSGSFYGFVGIGNNYGSDDGAWGSRLNVGGNLYARIDARCANDGIVTTMYSHTGQGVGKMGMMSNHPLVLMAQGAAEGGSVYSGSLRSPIFYDSNDTARYFNGNGGVNFITGSGNRVTVYSDDSGWHVTNAEGTGVDVRLGAAYGLPGIYVNPNLYLSSESNVIFRIANGERGYMDVGSNLFAYGSMRAPIFYDYNNTAYYADFADTTTSINVNGSIVINNGASSNTHGLKLNGANSRIWFDGRRAIEGDVSGANFQLGEGYTFTTIYNQTRSPIFYDSNNTGYYVDPASTSNLNLLGLNSHLEQGNNLGRPQVNWSASGSSTGMVIFYLPGTTSNYGMVHMVFDIYEYNSPRIATVIVGGHNWSTAWYNTGCNVVGYTDKSVRLGVKDGRFCVVFGGVGSSWSYGTIVLRKIHNGAFYDNIMDMLGNWSATQTNTESFTSISGDLRGLRTPSTMEVDGILYGYNSVRSPIFYDSADTTYYINANDWSFLYGVGSYYLRNNYDVSVDHPYGMYFANNLSTAYAIYREAGAWTYPYPDLRIAFHTGIKLGANASYNGIRFYTDYDMSSQVMSVNNSSDGLGGGNVYVNNGLQAGSSLRAPIFYDSDNTGYYLDPTSTTALRTVGDWRADSAAWTGEFAGKMQYHSSNWYLQFSSTMIFRNSGGSNIMTCDSSGNVTFSGNVTAYSDARIKENIVTIDSALDKATRLRGVYYNKIGDTDRRSGVVAQEVIDVFPEVVRLVQDADPSTGETKELYAVDYGNLVGLLIEAVKELSAKVDELQKRN